MELFDPGLGRRGANRAGGEDTEMYRRLVAAGCTVRWAPDAIIYHRIRSDKLSRRFFFDLHYEMGKIEGATRRGRGARVPPLWSFGYFARALLARWSSERGKVGPLAASRNERLPCRRIPAGWALGPRIQFKSGCPSPSTDHLR